MVITREALSSSVVSSDSDSVSSTIIGSATTISASTTSAIWGWIVASFPDRASSTLCELLFSRTTGGVSSKIRASGASGSTSSSSGSPRIRSMISAFFPDTSRPLSLQISRSSATVMDDSESRSFVSSGGILRTGSLWARLSTPSALSAGRKSVLDQGCIPGTKG